MRTVLQAFSLIKRIFYSTLIRFITHFNRLWAQNTWVKMRNELFELNVSQKLLKVSEGHKVKYKAECIHVWHNRMGHRDQQAIRLLERQNKASGININP